MSTLQIQSVIIKPNFESIDSIHRSSQSPQLLIIRLKELPLLIPYPILRLLRHLLPQRWMERQYIQVLGVIHKPLTLELFKWVRQDGPLDLDQVIQKLTVIRTVRTVDR